MIEYVLEIGLYMRRSDVIGAIVVTRRHVGGIVYANKDLSENAEI